jgi:hypothetical protein
MGSVDSAALEGTEHRPSPHASAQALRLVAKFAIARAHRLGLAAGLERSVPDRLVREPQLLEILVTHTSMLNRRADSFKLRRASARRSPLYGDGVAAPVNRR